MPGGPASALLTAAVRESRPSIAAAGPGGTRAGETRVGVQDPPVAGDADDEQDPERDAADVDEPGSAESDADTAAVPEESIDWFDGRLSMRYLGRWTGESEDHKLFATLSADVGDAEHHDVTAHFMGRVVANMERGNAQFADIIDTWDGDVVGFVYDAYIDVHSISGLDRARLGRQWLADTPVQAFFDGAHVETSELGDTTIQLGAYGGASARLYESSQSGDWLVGGYAEARPWTGGRLRLDYMHMESETLLATNQNDLFGASVWQSIATNWQVEGEYTMLESESRDVRSRLAYYDAESDVMVQGTYYQQLMTLKDLVQELDPYFNALQELFPFYQFGVMASKGLGEHVNVEGGTDVRRVEDEGDVGQFNRDYERYYANVRFDDVLLEGFSATVMTDLWYADGRDVRTWGFDLSQALSDPLTASLGSYYSLFKYDMFTTSERDDVRTYYVQLNHKTTEAIGLEVAYELEDNDFDVFHTLRLRGTWRF